MYIKSYKLIKFSKYPSIGVLRPLNAEIDSHLLFPSQEILTNKLFTVASEQVFKPLPPALHSSFLSLPLHPLHQQ